MSTIIDQPSQDDDDDDDDDGGSSFAAALEGGTGFGEGVMRAPAEFQPPPPPVAGQSRATVKQEERAAARVFARKHKAPPARGFFAPPLAPRPYFTPDVDSAIKAAADKTGVSADTIARFVKIESGGHGNVSAGSYHGLLQLSNGEFQKYGGGDIYNPYDNALAGAYKIKAESASFKQHYGRMPTAAELYMIHQQGAAGAAAHWDHPDRLAWENMASTGEGKQKGEAWAKRAIWGNVPDNLKPVYGSVDNMTSRQFTQMWTAKIDGDPLPMLAQNSPTPHPGSYGALKNGEASQLALDVKTGKGLVGAALDKISQILS